MLQRPLSSGTFLTLMTAGFAGLLGCSSQAVDSQTTGASGATPVGMAGTVNGVGGTVGVGAGGTVANGTAGQSVSGSAGMMTAMGGAAVGGASTGGAGAGGVGGAGGVSQAGSGGAAGAAGTMGVAGAGGGLANTGPSSACGGPIAPDALVDPVRHDMMVTVAEQYRPTYEPRYYFTNLPETWDPTTPYPVIMYGNGCGQTQPEGGPFAGLAEYIYVQLIPASVDGDTVVPPGGSPGCFQAGRKGLPDSPDGPYFDQVLAEVAATYCIDLGQIYVAGWSSGSWLSNWLACSRGGVIRSTVAGSGGLFENHGPCTAGTAAMIFAGDAGSTTEDGFDIGAAYARDTLIETNGCDPTPTSMQFGAANCDYYGTCTGAPVAYCTDGGGHGGPLGFMKDSGLAFWATVP